MGTAPEREPRLFDSPRLAPDDVLSVEDALREDLRVVLQFVLVESPVVLVRLVVDLLHQLHSVLRLLVKLNLTLLGRFHIRLLKIDALCANILIDKVLGVLHVLFDFSLELLAKFLGKHAILLLECLGVGGRGRDLVHQGHDLFDQVLVIEADRFEDLVCRGHNFTVDAELLVIDVIWNRHVV